jgi:hypothetical protein
MPGSADFPRVKTDTFVSSLVNLLKQIEAVGNAPAGDVQQEERNIREARQLLTDARNVLTKWTGVDLAEDFRDAYKNGTQTPLTPPASSMSTAHRKRLLKNGNAALNDVDQWVVAKQANRRAGSDLTKVRKFIKNGEKNITSGGMSPKQKETLRKQIDDARLLEKKISSRKPTLEGDRPEVLYRRRKRVGGNPRGAIAARKDAVEYFKMLGDTGHRDIINAGYVQGEKARGTVWFLVSDGPDCGWTSHRDPERANGKIVREEDIIPYAHPHCQRNFVAAPDGPNGKGTKNLIKQLMGITDNATFKTAVKVASVVGSTGLAVSKNPLVRETVRDLLADKEIALSENAKKILGRWVNGYQQTETIVLKRLGREVNQASQEGLRTEVRDGVERKIVAQGIDGNDFTKITINRNEAAVLRLGTTVTRGQLLERLADYTDFVRHMEDAARPALRSVGAAAQDNAAMDEIYGQSAAAIRATWLGRSNQFGKITKKTYQLMKIAVEKNPQRAELEAIKTLVRIVDPLPWVRVPLGPSARFTVGMNADNRAAIAGDLWKRMRGYEFRLKAEPTFAWRTHTPLKNTKISAQDIYEALTPRITFFGPHINATLVAENGHLIPSFKLFPEGTYLKYLSMSARLRTQYISDLIAEARELSEGEWPEFLKRKLSTMDEDTLFTIDAFRNGPIKFAARFWGSELDSLAVKFRPDNGVVRWTHDFYRRPTGHMKARKNMITLVPKFNGGYTIPKAGGQALSAETMSKFAGFVKLKGSLSEVVQIMGLDFMSAARDLRDFLGKAGVQLKDFLEVKLQNVTDMIQITPYRLQQFFKDTIARLKGEDLEARVGEILVTKPRHPGALHGTYATRADIPDEIWNKYISPEVRATARGNKLESDLASSLKWFMDKFPDREPPDFVMLSWAQKNLADGDIGQGDAFLQWTSFRTHEEHAAFQKNLAQFDEFTFEWVEALWSRRKGRIVIPDRVAHNWDLQGSLVKEQQKKHWWNPRGQADPITLIGHEMGHHWSMHLNTHEELDVLSNFWEKTFRNPEVIKIWNAEPPKLSKIIENNFGDEVETEDWSLNQPGELLQLWYGQIHDWMAQPGVQRQVARALSDYGAVNAYEMFAELFAEVTTGDDPTALARFAREVLKI